jgi:hypothetical protein
MNTEDQLQTTTGPVPGFPTLNPEGPMVEGPMVEGPMVEGPMVEGPVPEGPMAEGPVPEGPMSSNAIGLQTAEAGDLVKLGDLKYIVKNVAIGVSNIYELIDLGTGDTSLKDKNIKEFIVNKTNLQQNALDITTSPLLGYKEFGIAKTGKISDSDELKEKGVKSYYVIDPLGTSKKVTWTGYWGSDEFNNMNKYIYKKDNKNPTADNIKDGKYTKPDELIKYINQKGGRKTRRSNFKKSRSNHTRRSR